MQPRKNLTRIMAAHGIPYVAQTSPAHWRDSINKFKKALETEGPKFINAFSPCNRGWRSATDDAILLSRLAADTCYWPLYEIEDGVTKINYVPKEKKPIEEFLKPQGRFKHMFAPGNEWIVRRLQEEIDREWERLNREAQISSSST
jgi:pyruvate ferredoxin oxidoreductase beta subunit